MPNKLKPGQEIVPGYVLVRRLGAGGSGEVWVARASGGVQVAIKVLSDMALIASDRELDALRVVREAKHPNLCPIFGVWFFDSDHNLLSSQETELILGSNSDLTETVAVSTAETRDSSVDGPPLDEATLVLPDDTTKPAQMVVAMGLGEQTLMDRLVQVQAEKELVSDATMAASPSVGSGDYQVGIDADELMRYMSSAASAIDELNERHNIYHCDIKPQNILLVGGQAQVCDFGLARKVEDSRKTTIAFGTPAYGTPEMLFERTYSKTIDQYSLAVTYYELRTGKLPYSSVTQSALLRAKATGEVDLSRVPQAERDVLARATDLDPDKRYKNCMTMVAALDSAIKNPDPVVARSSRLTAGIAAPVAAVSVLALLTALGFMIPWKSFFGDALAARSTESETEQPSTVTDSVFVGPEVSEASVDSRLSNEGGMQREVSPTGMPETLEPEPETPQADPPASVSVPPKPDFNQRLIAMLQADQPNPERLAGVLAIFQSSDFKPDSLAQATLRSLVDGIEQGTDDQSDSSDRSHLQKIVQLCTAIIPIAGQRQGNDSPSVARLHLSKLTAAAKLASDGQLASSDVDSIRTYFNDQNQFAHPPASYRAAMLVANTWLAKFEQSNWECELAHADIARAQRLSAGASESDPVLTNLNQAYLIALLSSRSDRNDLDSINQTTVRTAKMLEDDDQYGSLARSAISLVDATAKTHSSKPMGSDIGLLKSVPPPAQAAVLLGAGWNHWHYGKIKDAVDQWTQATEISATDRPASSDRQTAARQLLEWLLDRSKVAGNDVSEMRYAGKSPAVNPLLSVVGKLADGDAVLLEQVNVEQFICSVAGGDFKDAALRWVDIESNSTIASNLNRQQGRALFELSLNQVGTNPEKLDPQWANRLLLACSAQTDPALFVVGQSRPPNSSVARDDLFERCFKPTMDLLRVQLKSPEQTKGSGLDQESVVVFCDRFVSLLSETDRRPDYDAVSPCMKDLELVASIAGNGSDEPIRRSELFFHAAIAHARDAHDQADSRPYLELITPLRKYRDLSKKFGSSAYTDCLDGLISKEDAFRSTDPKESFDLHADAVAKFTNAIHSKASGKQSVLGFAHAGRAIALQRGAILQSTERRERQLNEALEDARGAVEACQDSAYDKEYALENLARICCAVSQITKEMDTKEKLTLIAQAKHAVDGAIAIRKNKSLDTTHLSQTKLFVLWIDTLVSKDSSYANASIQRAKNWMKETENTGKQVESPWLMCNWYFTAAMILEQAEETDLALNHLVTARQICKRDLEKSDRLTHLVTLAHVNLKSYRTHVGSRRERLQLIDELIEDLKSIVDPPPPIANERDLYLEELKKRRAAR